MVWEAETRKRLEAAIEVVNDCLNILCKAETRDNAFVIQCVNLNV